MVGRSQQTGGGARSRTSPDPPTADLTVSPSYPPTTSPHLTLDQGERHLHTFRIRGYRFTLLTPEPVHENYLAHLTPRRMLLEPLDPQHDAISLPWNDIIELQPVAGSRIVDELPGVEDHMMLVVASTPALQHAMDRLLLSAEAIDDPAPARRAQHSTAFLDIVEELLCDAYEA